MEKIARCIIVKFREWGICSVDCELWWSDKPVSRGHIWIYEYTGEGEWVYFFISIFPVNNYRSVEYRQILSKLRN